MNVPPLGKMRNSLRVINVNAARENLDLTFKADRRITALTRIPNVLHPWFYFALHSLEVKLK
jgi:hypothetical protein